MSKKTEKKGAEGEAVEAVPAIVEKQYESVVDKVFDAAIASAAKALVGVKNGLEASARWLDGRAKVFGELAGKLTA